MVTEITVVDPVISTSAVIDSMYHFQMISGDLKHGAKYRATHRSGIENIVDPILCPELVAAFNVTKGFSKKSLYQGYYLKFDGPERIRGCSFSYSTKLNSGSGQSVTPFRDDCFIVTTHDGLYLYKHKLVAVVPLISKIGTSDDTKMYLASLSDTPYRRYLRGDKEILSEMNMLALNATKI